MGLYDFGIYGIIKRNARVAGERTSLIYRDERVSHRQYLERVNRLARGLSAVGIGRGDRIGVLAMNSLEFMYLYGAAAKLGAIMLPVNWRLKPEEVEYVLCDGAPRVVFADGEFQGLVESLSSGLGFVERYFSMGKGDGRFRPFGELMDNDGKGDEPEVRSGDAFVIIHTAAVAGKPRGATLSHLGLLMANLQAIYYFRLTPEDCHLLMLPLFHLAGLGTCLNVMHAGGRNVILPKFDPDLALHHIQEDRASIFVEFPPMLAKLLERNEELGCDLSSLRVVAGLDHPDTVRRFEELTGGTFWTAFGQSETSGFVTFAPYFERPGAAGLPAYLAEVEVVDEGGRILPPGKTGEIVVRGPMVFKGYWKLEKDNEYTFRGGWHHTGDMGRFDDDGYLFYAGRMPEKELIKPGGENVYPAEVEKAILEHPGVAEASVIGVPDQQWGEAIKAVCVLRDGVSLSESDLIDFVASRIARFKKPKHVVFVPSLPKAPDGSIDRTKVKADHAGR
jgi:acyl-CoA synthetase (AMP-forming)/AMP-acid ligase II